MDPSCWSLTLFHIKLHKPLHHWRHQILQGIEDMTSHFFLHRVQDWKKPIHCLSSNWTVNNVIEGWKPIINEMLCYLVCLPILLDHVVLVLQKFKVRELPITWIWIAKFQLTISLRQQQNTNTNSWWSPKQTKMFWGFISIDNYCLSFLTWMGIWNIQCCQSMVHQGPSPFVDCL